MVSFIAILAVTLHGMTAFSCKAGFLVNAHNSRHLLQVVQGRLLFIAPPLALGFLGSYVYHALYAVLFRGVYSGFATL